MNQERASENWNIWRQQGILTPEEKLLLQTAPQSPDFIDSFGLDLDFGTGGLRGIMGLGPNRMNRYTLRRATQAFALSLNSKTLPSKKVVLCFDCRHHSREFAQEVACVFAANGFTSLIFPDLRPVPLLSFAIRELGACAGVMITASHNPPEYNGYKAFDENGQQVIPPLDQDIMVNYKKLQDWSEMKTMDFKKGIEEKKILFVSTEIEEKYYQALKSNILNPALIKNHGHQLKIVYTSLHGTGSTLCPAFAHRLGFSRFKLLEAQAIPDGRFPTVKSPNPEEPSALELAVKEMIRTEADLVLGTDPDTDRLGVALLHQGQPKFLNGNQIAILMLDYLFSQRKEKGTLPSKPFIIKSIMTSEMQTVLAKNYGVQVYNTLTGFKWMGSLLTQLESQGEKGFLFASEESFGYMPHSQVRDKDGVSALLLTCELALFHRERGKNLIEVLDELYEKFGYFQEGLLTKTYPGVEGSFKIKALMDYFRKEKFTHLLGEKIISIHDWECRISTDLLTGKENKINLPQSNVLAFDFEEGHRLFLRPSGTEPKIKFYSLIQISKGSLKEKKANAKIKIENWEKQIAQMLTKI